MQARRLPALLALTMLTAAVSAQEGAVPVAEEMAKFDTHIGNWQGAGIVRGAPDAPAMEWTSTSTVKRILGGHFTMDQMKIEIAGLPVAMIFNSVTGWDSTHERFVSFQVGNTGEVKESTPHFVGNKVISTSGGVEEGSVVADHWVTVIEGDEMHFTGHRSVDGGPFFVHVEGSAKRGGPGFSVGPETADHAMAPPNEHMEHLAGLVGTWDFAGDWKPAPDAEAMTMTGREKTHRVLGGHAIRSHVNGEVAGMNYKALNFMAWSPDEKCILTVGLNNMGEYHATKCWMVDGKLLSVQAGPYQGVPTMSRGIMTIAPDELTWTGHMASGTDEPYLAFTGTWTRSEH